MANDGSLAPRTSVRVLYDNRDITRDIAPYVEGLTWTDTLEEADDLQITLADPEGLWAGDWMPEDNARISVDIISVVNGQQSLLPCGIFFVDTVDENGPPASVTVKGTSADFATSLRREVKTRAWEHASLKAICQDIASGGGLRLQYLTAVDPSYERIEQKRESDLAFVMRIVNNEALRVKVSGASLVVYDMDAFNNLAEIETYSKPKSGVESRVKSWSLQKQVAQAYQACEVKYRDPKKKKTLKYLYCPGNAPDAGAILRIGERVESLAHAERLAKAKLAFANRMANNASITVIGDTRLVVGVNIRLNASWGRYAGKYAVEEATHSVWAYTTELKLRLVG